PGAVARAWVFCGSTRTATPDGSITYRRGMLVRGVLWQNPLAPPVQHAPNRKIRMRILVIEDNQDIAANLGDFLEDRGHTVDFAADGITGLHLAVVHDFDAIVLDLNLPGLHG